MPIVRANLLEDPYKPIERTCCPLQSSATSYALEHRVSLPSRPEQVNHKDDGLTVQGTEKGWTGSIQEENSVQDQLLNRTDHE